MAFGSKFIETGTFGKKGKKTLSGMGYADPNEFLNKYNLGQGSSKADFKYGLGEAKKQVDNTSDAPFKYTDLPEQGAPNSPAAPLRDAGNAATASGQDLVGGSMNTLGSLLGSIQGQSNSAFRQGRMAEGLSLGAQNMAENPDFNPATQGLFDQRAQARVGEVDKLFGKGGAEQEQLGRNLADQIANLDELGVSGTSESSMIGKMLGDFQGKKYQATQAANELSRNEQLGERQDIRGAGLNLAGLRSGESLGQSQIGAGLLGTGSSASLGAGNLGSDLQKTGIGANDAALTQEGNAREREAGLQQSERAFDMNIQQQNIDNWLRNQGIAKGSALEKQLMGLLGLSGGGQ
jgi:hypothetical protein